MSEPRGVRPSRAVKPWRALLVAAALLGCGAAGGPQASQTAPAPAPDAARPAEDQAADARASLAYVGTYTTSGKSRGIHLFRLQPQGTEVFQNVTLVPLG